MASFVPVHDMNDVEFSVNLDQCNYLEIRESGLAKGPYSTVLYFAGSDPLEVKETRDEIIHMNARLHKGK